MINLPGVLVPSSLSVFVHSFCLQSVLLQLLLDAVVDFSGVTNRMCRVMEANDAGGGANGGVGAKLELSPK